jgi:hypothetical protein
MFERITPGPDHAERRLKLPNMTAMTHIVIQEHLNGKAVDWMETVTDEQYAGSKA